MTSEVIHALERATGGAPVDTDVLLARIRAVRERAALPYRTPDELRRVRDILAR